MQVWEKLLSWFLVLPAMLAKAEFEILWLVHAFTSRCQKQKKMLKYKAEFNNNHPQPVIKSNIEWVKYQ